MTEIDVGFRDVAVSLVLVAVVVAVSVWRHLDLERSLVWAATRAVTQLVLVGLGLSLVIAEGRSLAWSWLWVLVMALVAADVVRRRAPPLRGIFLVAVVAFAASGAITLGVLFGLGIFPAEPRTVVPFAGLVVGNTMRSAVLVVHRVVEELRDKRAEVEARLALAHPAPGAASPYIRSALRDALIPQIDGTRTVGLIALPGAMTGLILAGADPLDAVLVQVVVMFLVLASAASTSTVMAMGVARRMFTPDHRLVDVLPGSSAGSRRSRWRAGRGAAGAVPLF